jgi:hypothetical protein
MKYKFKLFLLQKNGNRVTGPTVYEYYFPNFLLCGLKLKYTITLPPHIADPSSLNPFRSFIEEYRKCCAVNISKFLTT